MKTYQNNDGVFLYLSELSSKVVAESGVPSDRYHLGKLILKTLRTYPEWTLQIDANTNAQESSKSVLSRSIRCAYSMKRRGLNVGDVIVLMAPNHLDQCIPFYAANYLGIIVYPLDIYLKKEEIVHFMEIGKPKLVFCQNNRADDVAAVLKSVNMTAEVITYDKSNDFLNFDDFLTEGVYGKEDDFKASDFDPESTITCLIPTSGTTGLPKATSTSHENMAISLPYFWLHESKFPNSSRGLVVSTLQWYSGLLHYYSSGLFAYTRVQTSAPFSNEHFYYIINTYKPSYIFMSPALMALLLKDVKKSVCDFASFKYVHLGGSPVPEELMTKLREMVPHCFVSRVYGMSELSGYGFYPCGYPPNALGRLIGLHQVKIVDPDSGAEITEANKTGEIWFKGPAVFKGYFNREIATRETFSDDGWFKSGDLMFRDEYDFFYYVDRLKSILKYNNNQISPAELENVIRRHPKVEDVIVIGVHDDCSNDLPVACVIKHKNTHVTAQEIKDLINNTLAESKQLRGGVVFLDSFPMTVSMKVDRKKLKEVVLQMNRE